MYYIVNKTKSKTIKYEGSFPSDFAERMLNNQEDLIIISTYSNTVNVPFKTEYGLDDGWIWEEYPITDYLINQWIGDHQETEGV